MVDLGSKFIDSADSVTMKAITRYVFLPAIVALCAVSTMYLHSLTDKIEGAASRADVEKTATALKADSDRANTALWNAIGSTTKAQSELVTNMAVLQSQVAETRQTFSNEQTYVHNTLSDIQNRLNGRQPALR